MGRIYNVSVKKTQKNICVSFDVSEELKKYFKLHFFSVDYDVDISPVPDSVALVPFVCNVLPIVWLTDSDLELPCLDESFYNSINEFKKGYVSMHPVMSFKGRVLAKEIEKNILPQSDKVATFFSGGADAYATLIAHIDEKPILLTLRGSDVALDDNEGWENVSRPIIEASNEFGLDYHFIATNFREFDDENELCNLVELSKDSWWHGFQHGIGLIGHAAPLSYVLQIKTIYIAASFTIAEKGKVTCASDPSIDNFVKFVSAGIIHDQYEYNRQEKISHICSFVKRTGHKVRLHVCWQSRGGKNCCRCEKCYRTIMEIVAENADPNDYGFQCDSETYKQIETDLKWKIFLFHTKHWEAIQKRFVENAKDLKKRREFAWVYSINMKRINKRFSKRLLRKAKYLKGKFLGS